MSDTRVSDVSKATPRVVVAAQLNLLRRRRSWLQEPRLQQPARARGWSSERVRVRVHECVCADRGVGVLHGGVVLNAQVVESAESIVP